MKWRWRGVGEGSFGAAECTLKHCTGRGCRRQRSSRWRCVWLSVGHRADKPRFRRRTPLQGCEPARSWGWFLEKAPEQRHAAAEGRRAVVRAEPRSSREHSGPEGRPPCLLSAVSKCRPMTGHQPRRADADRDAPERSHPCFRVAVRNVSAEGWTPPMGSADADRAADLAWRPPGPHASGPGCRSVDASLAACGARPRSMKGKRAVSAFG